jgi:hypothetical protein
MTRQITGTAGAILLLATHMNAGWASAARLNRPLADQLTQQFNQQELEQMQSGNGANSQSGADQLNRQQLEQRGTPPIPPRGAFPPPAELPYSPR